MKQEHHQFSFSKQQSNKIKIKPQYPIQNVIINLSNCQYPILRVVAKNLNYTIQQTNKNNWDMLWTDNAVAPQFVFKMAPYQKINHFPGMYVISRKNLLGKALGKMKKQFQKEYDFFPLTWMLPSQYNQFRNYFQSKQQGKTRTYIVKPEAGCQGKGIFLTRKLDDLIQGQRYVVQRYITKPYLIDNLKFDFRIYALIASVDPLRIYLFEQGLARFATEPYQCPNLNNLHNLCMHLTNYAINKDNPKFIFNQSIQDMSIGHKKSYTLVLKLLENQGVNITQLKSKINDIIIKTIITGLPTLSHQYNACQRNNLYSNICFQILGFDIILTSTAVPKLLQVNYTPSFSTDTPLDELIKKNLITDTLKLMNVTKNAKSHLITKKKDNKEKLTINQRMYLKSEGLKNRDTYEQQNLGNFIKIYPIYDRIKMQQYNKYIKHSQNLFNLQNGMRKKKFQDISADNINLKKNIIQSPQMNSLNKKINSESKLHQSSQLLPDLKSQQIKKIQYKFKNINFNNIKFEKNIKTEGKLNSMRYYKQISIKETKPIQFESSKQHHFQRGCYFVDSSRYIKNKSEQYHVNILNPVMELNLITNKQIAQQYISKCENQILKSHRKSLLLQHYRKEIIKTIKKRKMYQKMKLCKHQREDRNVSLLMQRFL